MWACDYEILIANNAFCPWMILGQFAIKLPWPKAMNHLYQFGHPHSYTSAMLVGKRCWTQHVQAKIIVPPVLELTHGTALLGECRWCSLVYMHTH